MAVPVTVLLETILVVEDNPLVLQVVSYSLKRAGFTVLSAAGPDEAMRIEGEFSGPIHLLLSDVIMLRTCGPELAEGLKSRRPQMRVMLMSGSPDDARLLNCDYHFLQKPPACRDPRTAHWLAWRPVAGETRSQADEHRNPGVSGRVQ